MVAVALLLAGVWLAACSGTSSVSPVRAPGAAPVSVVFQESWRDAALGIVCVSNSASHARSMAEAVAAYVDESRLDAITGSIAIDVSEVLE
jgi:hypothetical protein